eukprot:TRINITY_DN11228_c1_g1_i1.p1 TRINITY_DN11228_c1_g1~~TRINITY_DN11228_c1_g1_i1.p1  ORF type:complete len:531 (+),score=34.48 TRINITY_DN11228_c1_g1_i1:306-1898(+)
MVSRKPTISIPSDPAPEPSVITIENLKLLHKIRQDAEKYLKSVQLKKLTIIELRKFLNKIISNIGEALCNESAASAFEAVMKMITTETDSMSLDEKKVLGAVPALLHDDINPSTILSRQTNLIILANLFDLAQTHLDDPSSGVMSHATAALSVSGDAVKDFTDPSNGAVYQLFTYTNLAELLYFKESAVATRFAIESLKVVMNTSYQMDISEYSYTANVYKTFCAIFNSPLVKEKYIEINNMLDPDVPVKDIEKHMGEVQEILRKLWVVDDSVLNKLSGGDNTWLAVTLRGEHVCIRKSIIEAIRQVSDPKSKLIAEAVLLIILIHEGSHIKRFLSGCAFVFFGTPKNYKSIFDSSDNVKGEMGEWMEDFLYGCKIISGSLTEDQSKELLNLKNYTNKAGIGRLHDVFKGHQEIYRKAGSSTITTKFEPKGIKKDVIICGSRFFSITPRSFDLSKRLAKMLGIKDKEGKQQHDFDFNVLFVALNEYMQMQLQVIVMDFVFQYIHSFAFWGSNTLIRYLFEVLGSNTRTFI